MRSKYHLFCIWKGKIHDLAAHQPSWAGFRRKHTHLENIWTFVCWRKQNGDNMKHLIVASPLTVSTTLLPQKKSLPRIHFSPPQTSKVLLCSLYLCVCRRRSLPAVRCHKRNREYLMLSELSGSCEGPDDSARHMCGAGERCCVIVWRGCWQSVVPTHGTTVRHNPDPLDPAPHLPPHPPPPFLHLRVKHLLLSFCLSLPSPTLVFSLKVFFFLFSR